LIAEHSEGIPRNINNLCFNAMSIAYAIGHKQIDSEIVREVISDLKIESLLPRAELAARSSASRPAFVVRITSAASAPEKPHRRGTRVLGRPLRARLAIASFAAVVVLGVASGIAWDRGVSTPTRTMRSTVEAASTPQALPRATMVPMARLTKVKPVSSGAGSRSSAELSENVSGNNMQKNDHILTIVVEKDTTLRQLSLKNLGWFDQTTVVEICRLNPEITDPNRIQAGQRLRIPLKLLRTLPSDREFSSGTGQVVPHEEKP